MVYTAMITIVHHLGSLSRNYFAGHVPNPAYVSNTISLCAVPRTFVQWLTNTFATAYSTAMYEYKNWLLTITDSKSYDLSPSVQLAVIFQNSRHRIETSRLIPIDLVNVEGIHLKPAKNVQKKVILKL